MSDKQKDTSEQNDPVDAEIVGGDDHLSTDGAPAPARQGTSRIALVLALLALIIAIAGPLALWKWSEKNTRELVRRVQSSGEQVQSGQSQMASALDQLRDLKSRTEMAESKLSEAAGHQAQLAKLYKSVALDSADASLAELESALALAAQQLASGGSAEAALLALQSADGRLARLDDPGLAGVRRAIARDVERLRGATSGDIGVLAARLDALAHDLDGWPLLATLQSAAPAAPPAAPGTDASAPGRVADSSTGSSDWRRWIRIDTLMDELASLFRVRRVDAPDAALIAPDQTYFLRENLRLRLLSARLALLARHDPLYRGDLERSKAWIARYYDVQDGAVAAALAQLDELRDARAAGAMPTVVDSLGAVRAARAAREPKE